MNDGRIIFVALAKPDVERMVKKMMVFVVDGKNDVDHNDFFFWIEELFCEGHLYKYRYMYSETECKKWVFQHVYEFNQRFEKFVGQ